MLTRLSDPALPGLSQLGPDDLARITGSPDAHVLRLRHQPGARAVLHVAFKRDEVEREGAVWLFTGTKARKLARQDAATVFDVPAARLRDRPYLSAIGLVCRPRSAGIVDKVRRSTSS